MNNSKCFAVIGLHRSGTSTVAGILHKLGVSMGEVLLKPQKSNPKGFYEDVEFLNIHQQILPKWKEDIINLDLEYIAAYKELISHREKKNIWGVKDPRFCFIFDLFEECLDPTTELNVINVHRDLPSVAKSMSARQFDFPVAEALKLCKELQSSKEKFLDKSRGKIITIDYNMLIRNKEKEIKKIADFSDLPLNENAVGFVDFNLAHHKPSTKMI